MFNMILENKDGKQLTFGAGSPYTIKEFQGLNPPKATINTNTTATLDGGKFNSSKLDMRNINIAFAIEENAEENRLAVYKVIQSKMPLRIYYNSDFLDVFIDGYVEDVDISYFAMKNIVTVNVLCPFPYLKGAQEIINELAAVRPKFHFPFHSAQSKNLLTYPYYNTTKTQNGVTFTDNGDGSITVNGTATGNAAVFVLYGYYSEDTGKNPTINTSEPLKLTGCPANGSNQTYYLQLALSKGSGSWQGGGVDYGEGVTLNPIAGEDHYYIYVCRIVIMSGTTVDNLIFKPMLRLASIQDDTWQSPTYSEKFIMGEVDTLATVSIPNDGSVVAGLTFELYAKKAVSNPKIIDYLTAEYMEININMQMGDLVTITTEQGNKTVTLLRDGVRTNIFNLLSKNSTWLQLDIGGGIYVYEVGTGTTIDLDVTIKHYDLYEGV